MYRTKHLRITDYIMRQYATAMQAFSEMKPLYKNQMEVYNLVYDTLKGLKYYPKGKWLSYNSLDYLLKITKDPAYYALQRIR